MKSDYPSISIPLPGIIFFLLILAAATFYSGLSFSQSRNGSNKNEQSATAVFTPKKSDKPDFDFYVMSFCPYGNQAEDIIKPVADLLGDKANIKPRYIFDKVEDLNKFCQSRSGDPNLCTTYIKNGYFKTETECKTAIEANLTECKNEKNYLKTSNGRFYSSLHGRQEANQDLREICAFNLASNKKDWWNFIGKVNLSCNSENADTCWEEQAKQAGFDSNKINDCFNQQAVDLIEKEISETTQNKVSSSPTIIINGVSFPPESAYTQDGKGTLKIGNKVITQSQYRTSEAFKLAICASFNKPPKECSTVLSDTSTDNQVAAGGCN